MIREKPYKQKNREIKLCWGKKMTTLQWLHWPVVTAAEGTTLDTVFQKRDKRSAHSLKCLGSSPESWLISFGGVNNT